MKQISYVLREEIPLVAETEILVVGSGPGGLCAAVTAARRGRQVTMAEHYGSPGGMANVGEISPARLPLPPGNRQPAFRMGWPDGFALRRDAGGGGYAARGRSEALLSSYVLRSQERGRCHYRRHLSRQIRPARQKLHDNLPSKRHPAQSKKVSITTIVQVFQKLIGALLR